MKIETRTIVIFDENEDIKNYYSKLLFYKYDFYLQKNSKSQCYKIIKSRLPLQINREKI